MSKAPGNLIVEMAAHEFLKQLEGELRQRMLDQATAEIEHIVREASKQVQATMLLAFNQMTQGYELTQSIKINGVTVDG